MKYIMPPQFFKFTMNIKLKQITNILDIKARHERTRVLLNKKVLKKNLKIDS